MEMHVCHQQVYRSDPDYLVSWANIILSQRRLVYSRSVLLKKWKQKKPENKNGAHGLS